MIELSLKKHLILIGIALSLILLVIATSSYPGGSQSDPHSVGYNWTENYLSNLFNPVAVNGAPNLARPWAIAAMAYLCASLALFFWQFSANIPQKVPARIIRYAGLGSMASALLIATPLHDLMITVSGTGVLVAIFYITIFVFRSKLLLLKVLSVCCLLLLYACSYMYYTQSYLELLPVMQKIGVMVLIIWVLGLVYGADEGDFQWVK